MANYKLVESGKQAITQPCHAALGRMVDAAQSEFPLSFDQVQNMITPAEDLRLMRALKERKNEMLGNDNAPVMTLFRQETPGLLRTAAMTIYGQGKRFLVTRSTMHAEHHVAPNYATRDNRNQHWYHTADLSVLDAGAIEALVEWTNRVVDAKRRRKLCVWAIEAVLSRCESTQAVKNTWPLLATFVEDETWKRRFREDIRRPDSYKRTVSDIEKPMAAASVILLGAQMLGKYEVTKTELRASVDRYLTLLNDWKPPA